MLNTGSYDLSGLNPFETESSFVLQSVLTQPIDGAQSAVCVCSDSLAADSSAHESLPISQVKVVCAHVCLRESVCLHVRASTMTINADWRITFLIGRFE